LKEQAMANYSRRTLLGATAMLLLPRFAHGVETTQPTTTSNEPIIDIHQHTNYSGRTDEQLIEHQKRMGVSLTVLLPAGSIVNTVSTHEGKTNGLAVQAGGNESCYSLAQKHPELFRFGANEVSDLPQARDEIAKYLKLGGVIVGEQKFNVEIDDPKIEPVFEVAGEFDVPVLIHFQYDMYNKGYERFWKVLEKFPKVKFIGHAQTVWANVDKQYENSKGLYPKGLVEPGGMTDQYLTRYPNFYADMSAGSGLNAMVRDEPHAREFIERHQDKLMFGSDCNDRVGHGPVCQGWLIIREIRKLASSKAVERKLLHDNANKLLKLNYG
jgi:predicted TIM-barrel fold metal-dependent hydrolase